jgi:hypothetical protein
MLARLVLAALLALGLAPAVAQSTDPSFNLVNRSGETISEIYVSPVTERTWGRDWLGTEVLPNGRAWPIRIAPSAGCQQDILVVYAGGRREERRNLNTCGLTQVVFGTAQPAPPPPAGAGPTGNPSFNLVNQGRVAMREVYVSSVREEMWGDSRLSRPMQPGEHLAVRLPENDCLNDVRVIWMDGRTEDRRGVNTCDMVNMVFR